MKLSQTDYVLRSLAKLAHKRWELFVISRIIHQLDNDIEFVTQQLVRGADGQRYLTDLYLPQLGLHLEVDERHHVNNQEADRFREMDIIGETGNRVEHIKTFEKNSREVSLQKVKQDSDAFVNLVQELKKKKQSENGFIPWDWERRYSSEAVIERGFVDVGDNVTFRLQVEALKCFGFKGKGWQKGAWNIPDGTGDWVWFPRLYPHFIWNNELTSDGRHIFQRATCEQGRKHNETQNEKEKAAKQGNVIVFAKAKDALGANVLRFVGTFRHNVEASYGQAIQFDRVSTREKVRPTLSDR